MVIESNNSINNIEISATHLGRMAIGRTGGGEASRGGVARNWTEMELSDLGKVLISLVAKATVVTVIGCIV